MAGMGRPRIAVTGAAGFLAWHVRCAARTRWGGDLICVERRDFEDPERLDSTLAEANAVIHLAGVNRAHNPADITEQNPWLAEQLVASLRRTGRQMPIIFGNTIHSRGNSIYGVSKRQAGEILMAWGDESGSPVLNVVMPNAFGEHGTPFYNSVVSTFCHVIAGGGEANIVDDKELPLVHVGQLADLLLDHALAPTSGEVEIEGRPTMVSEVAERLTAIAGDYLTGRLPDLGDSFTKELFNTYRSATFPQGFPIHPSPADDPRGRLVEAVKAIGGEAQVFYSTTNPGFTRGQHYHRHKVERFLVLSGQAEIRLRKLFTDEVIRFPVSGETPAIIDMPTLYVHSITNTGTDPLVTLFYADELFDPSNPDTYAEDV